MPVSRNALVRYKTIDNCLRNRGRKWTLEDLIDACSDALYEYEGISKGISRRTIQMDIQFMRSEKLGYNAPIIVKEHKYYEYEDPEYSITNTPLSVQDVNQLANAVAILKQLSGFTAFAGMEDIVGKLEDHISAVRQKKDPIIYYETNEALKGLQFITPIYEAISEQRPIIITYQSFKARDPHDYVFSPYVLKETRNRWFVFGKRRGAAQLFNFALDRIVAIEKTDPKEQFVRDKSFDPKTYFNDIIGVTKDPNSKPEKIRFLVMPNSVPYIETKPLHSSQMVIERREDGTVIFQIEVVMNFELERDLLMYGEGLKVLSPPTLVKRISIRLHDASRQYDF